MYPISAYFDNLVIHNNYIALKGTNHIPMTVGEVNVLVFEPGTTLNTGDTDNEFIKDNKGNYPKALYCWLKMEVYLRKYESNFIVI